MTQSTGTPLPLRVLLVEDSEDDARLLELAFRRSEFAPAFTRVETEPAMLAVVDQPWDVLITDHSLPRFSGERALEVARAHASELPVIVVSGTIGEEVAVELLKSGASDVVMKQNLARLLPAVRRGLAEARVRRERREALATLRRAVEVRDDFLSVAAHELRTPLTALRLQIEGLVRLFDEGSAQPGQPLVQKSLQRVSRSSGKLAVLIDRLLDVTLISTEGLVLRRARCDLSEIARNIAKEFADSWAQEAVIEVDAKAPVVGDWDRLRIETVLNNLLSNAVKYGGEKRIVVTVEALPGLAVLTVTDSGFGIAAADQDRIFGRFERAVAVQNYGGLGLGLWIAREIVVAHGGRISVKSSPGAGATFTVELPA